MPFTYYVTCFYNGRRYPAAVVEETKYTYLVEITNWYPFPIRLHFYKVTAQVAPGNTYSFRSGSMILKRIY